jgi:hypothetical protein
MKGLSNLLLVFSVQQQSKSGGAGGLLDRIPFLSQLQNNNANDTTKKNDLRNAKVRDLLQAATEIGQAGSLATKEEQK